MTAIGTFVCQSKTFHRGSEQVFSNSSTVKMTSFSVVILVVNLLVVLVLSFPGGCLLVAIAETLGGLLLDPENDHQGRGAPTACPDARMTD